MKMLKKMLAGVLVVAMLAPAVFAADSETAEIEDNAAGAVETSESTIAEQQESDRIYTKYRATAEKLTALGVLEDADFTRDELAQQITRGEFVSILCSLLKVNGVNDGTETPFRDVLPGSAYAADIKTAYDLGLINGVGNQQFYPDNPIKREEGVKIMVAAIGYDAMARQNGGYPTGYIYQADRLGLLDDVEGQWGQTMTRGDVYQMIANAIDVEILQLVGIGSVNEYQENAGHTLLSEKYDMFTEQGRITANHISALSPMGDKAPKNMISLDGTLYYEGSTGASMYLGYPVKLYVRQASGEEYGTVVYVEPRTDNLDMLEVSAKNIEEATTTHQLFYFNESGGSASATIEGTADLIYNGVARALDRDLLLQPESGKVVLMDANRDGGYDTVFVTSYVTYVVSAVNAETGMVSDMYDQPALPLDPEDQNLSVTIIREGREVSVASLAQYEVLSVAANAEVIDTSGNRTIDTENSVYYYIQSSTMADIGILESISNDSVTVNGTSYQIAEHYHYLRNNGFIPQYSPGDLLSFYFNYEDELVTISNEGLNLATYGFLLGVQKGKGLDSSVKLKILENSGIISQFDCSEKVTFDGHNATDTEEVFANLTDGMGNVNRQIIGYSTNSAGLINMIDTAATDAGGNGANSLIQAGTTNDLGEFTPELLSNVTYKSSDRAISDKYLLSSAATIFVVPEEIQSNPSGDSAELLNDKNYSVRKVSDLANDERLTCHVYNVDRVKTISLLVSYGSAASADMSTNTFLTVVDRLTTTLNEEGEEVRRLYGYQAGSELQADIATEDLYIYTYGDKTVIPEGADRLDSGDIIRCETNLSGEINKIEFIVDASDYKNYYQYNKIAQGQPSRTVFGIVYDFYNNAVELVVDPSKLDGATAADRDSTVYSLKTVPIMKYNGITETVTIGSSADIMPYRNTKDAEQATKIAINARYGEVRSIVIYEDMPQ